MKRFDFIDNLLLAHSVLFQVQVGNLLIHAAGGAVDMALSLPVFGYERLVKHLVQGGKKVVPGETGVISSNAPKTMLEYVGRITYDFMDSEGGSGYQATYFGEKNILNIGVGIAYQPNAAYKNTTTNPAATPSKNALWFDG